MQLEQGIIIVHLTKSYFQNIFLFIFKERSGKMQLKKNNLFKITRKTDRQKN